MLATAVNAAILAKAQGRSEGGPRVRATTFSRDFPANPLGPAFHKSGATTDPAVQHKSGATTDPASPTELISCR